MEFKANNPMKVDTEGGKGSIRRPVTGGHTALDIDGDEEEAKSPPKPRVAKPPKSGDVTPPVGSPPPPPPSRAKSSHHKEEREEVLGGDVELHNVATDDHKEHRVSKPVRLEKHNSERRPRESKGEKEGSSTPKESGKEGGRDSKKTGGGGGGDKGAADAEKSRFVGKNLVQYGLWAHYLAYGAALMCFCMGGFAMAWTDAHTYHCRINGDLINSVYLYDSSGACPSTFVLNGKTMEVCCNPEVGS